MELEKATPGGALVKRSDNQDKLAAGAGAAGLVFMLPFVSAHPFLALAAGIAAMLLSWESVTARDRRTALATAAFVMGAVPVAFEIFLLVGVLLKVLIVGGIIGGIYLGGRSIQKKRQKERDAESGPAQHPGSDAYAPQEP